MQLDAAAVSPLILSTALVLVSLIVLLRLRARDKSSKFDSPPGPKGLPIVGNAFQIPSKHVATYFRKLHAQYGGLVYLNLNGTPTYVISDMELAKELLERRSAHYSSRPVMPFHERYVDPVGDYWGMSRLGEKHFHGRRISASLINDVKAGRTEPLQHFEALLTVQHLLDDGGKTWYRHVHRGAISATFGAMFGVHYPTGTEPEMQRVVQLIGDFLIMLTPAASIINLFPILDLIPGPMPWRKSGLNIRQQEDEVYRPLLEDAISGSKAGMNTWTAAFASDRKGDGDRRNLVKPFSIAAIDTTALSVHTFVLACLLYPEFVKTAQKEIDAVVGTARLPIFADRPFLPYVEAVMREVLRWRPATRFGLPHETTSDDEVEYQGHRYFIPKGSSIYYTVWEIEHNEEKYPDPDIFRPGRFLDVNGRLKYGYETSAFGFGRRVCVGVAFAERALFINIAMLLWTFNISKSSEPDPQTSLPYRYDDGDVSFNGGITNGPYPFPAIFEPRSEDRVAEARREWEGCEKDPRVLLRLD